MGPATEKTSPLIKHLRLKTHLLPEMRSFYRDKIGFPLAADSAKSITFQAGSSLLTFEQVADSSTPWYHFAFNIPQNQVLAARKWQLERTALMPIPERLRDPAFPDDVVNYWHWNAHSVFFFDPAGNVVEYIARHDLPNDSKEPFSTKSILCASEIGLIVDDVTSAAADLGKTAGLEPYRGTSGVFTALGDEHGLLLVMKRGRILDFHPTSQAKAAKIFPTAAQVRGPANTAHKFHGFPYEIDIEK